MESVPAHWGALKVFFQSFPRFLFAAFFLSGQLKVESFFLAHWNWLPNAISPLPSETFRHILRSGFFPWCLVATPCRIMWVQGNKRDAVWLGLSLFKWLCIMFKSFGRSAVLVPVRLPPFGGSLVESFLVPSPPRLQLQQRQCRRAAETSLYLNINIIELFLSHGAGFWSQRHQPTAAATATGYKERWNLSKILTSCL